MAREAFPMPKKFKPVYAGSHCWEMDHIVPVVEGGHNCGLENYRTLCIPCHKRVSAELAARRARERRLKKQPELLKIS